MKVLLYYSFLFTNFILVSWLKIIKIFLRKKDPSYDLLILPYYPKEWPGNYRTAGYKRFFEEDGLRAKTINAWNKRDIEFFLGHSSNAFKLYRIYFKILFNRFAVVFKIRNFETIWIQRAFIPAFPFKHAYFEKLISTIHPNIGFDFYDADYESNYNLVFEVVKTAKFITVASEFLYNKFRPYNPNISFIRFSIEDANYIVKDEKNRNAKIIIGWMGSPSNAKQLIYIKEQLKQLEIKYENVIFSFVCRELPNLGLEKMELHTWGKNNFNYYEWLANLDIGIVPFIDQNERTKAKISMKGLEFMYCKIPMISSPYVHSDVLEVGKSFLPAGQKEWFSKLSLLIENEEFRYNIAQNAKHVFNKYHTYESNYQQLKGILLPYSKNTTGLY